MKKKIIIKNNKQLINKSRPQSCHHKIRSKITHILANVAILRKTGWAIESCSTALQRKKKHVKMIDIVASNYVY